MQKKCCSECGAELEPDVEFCPECGMPVQSARETDKLCPECGAELEPDAEFCPECGMPVRSSSFQMPRTDAQPVKRFLKRGILIPAAAAAATVFIVLMVVFNIPKNAEGINFDFDGFSGVYNGIVRSSVPQGEGSWLYESGNVRMAAEGEWKSGSLYNGTVMVTYKGETIGKVSYSDGKWDNDDYNAFCEAADKVNFANAFK